MTDSRPLPNAGVLISGRGSNLHALIDAIASGQLPARIGVVISTRSQAAGIELARSAGVSTVVLAHRLFGSREDYDEALARELAAHGSPWSALLDS